MLNFYACYVKGAFLINNNIDRTRTLLVIFLDTYADIDLCTIVGCIANSSPVT